MMRLGRLIPRSFSRMLRRKVGCPGPPHFKRRSCKRFFVNSLMSLALTPAA